MTPVENTNKHICLAPWDVFSTYKMLPGQGHRYFQEAQSKVAALEV